MRKIAVAVTIVGERERKTDREFQTGYITLKPQMNSPLSNKKRTLTYF